jgi:hypothetical protein
MDSDVFKIVLSVSLPVFWAGVGFLIKHIIEKKRDLYNQVNNERRELYQQFVNLIIDIFSSLKKNTNQPEKHIINKLYEFYKKSLVSTKN